MRDTQTFNTLCSASSPVITSIFFSKHVGDGLEERAAADSVRGVFFIESVPKRKWGKKNTQKAPFSLSYTFFVAPVKYLSLPLFITMSVSKKSKFLSVGKSL